MKKTTILISILLVISCTSLRKQDDEVRAELLELTPIGTSEIEVEKVINLNEWTIITKGGGIRVNEIENKYKYAGYTSNNNVLIIGNQSIVVELGIYSNVLVNVVVYAHYAFDDDKKLKEIVVHKIADGL